MSELEHHIDDELLSAYLDDELSPEERARVEARLAADPAARQMLDQLRVTSQALQGLPPEAVGQDLRESILRRAEAAMLTSGGQNSAAAATKLAATDNTVSLRDSLPRLTIGQTRRGWVWAALAMAAGLMIMVLQRDDRLGNEMPPVAMSRSSEQIDKVATTDRAAVPELHKLQMADPATPAPAAADHDAFAYSDSVPSASPGVATGAGTALPSSVALDTETAPAEASAPVNPSTSEDENGRNLAIGGAAVARAPSVSGGFGSAVERSTRNNGTVAEASPLRRFADEAAELKDANDDRPAVVTNGPASPPPAPSPSVIASSGRRMAEAPPQGGLSGEIRDEAVVAAEPAVADTLAKELPQAAEDDFLVVHVVVKPEALQSKAFDQLLTKHGIQLEETAEAESAADSTDEKASEESRMDRKSDRSGGQSQDERNSRAADDVILVAAPRSTIESCLADLKQDQRNYVGVAIDDMTPQAAAENIKSVEAATKPAKKLSTELGARFNRGKALDQDHSWYFRGFSTNRNRETAGGQGFGGGAGGYRGGTLKQEQAQLSEGIETSRLAGEESPSQGRARRVESWEIEVQANRDLQMRRGTIAEDRSATSTLQLEAIKQQNDQPAEPANENLYVLFVLSPDAEPAAAAAPSPPTENRPE
ncbi:MAG: zf-HC2 domain-containing protein [Pirellulales bacterium]